MLTLKDIFEQSQYLHKKLTKIFSLVKKDIEKTYPDDYKEVDRNFKQLVNAIENVNIDPKSHYTFQQYLELFVHIDAIYNAAFIIFNIIFRQTVIKTITENKSASFKEDIDVEQEEISNILSHWFHKYADFAKQIIDDYSIIADANVNAITNAATNEEKTNRQITIINAILDSPKTELFIYLVKLYIGFFNQSQKDRLAKKIEIMKMECFSVNDNDNKNNKSKNVSKNVSDIQFDKYVELPLTNQYSSRLGLIPKGKFEEIPAIFKKYNWHYTKTKSVIDNFKQIKSSFMLLYDIQPTIIQYNILPLIDSAYIDANDLHTKRNAPITDKILERFCTIKKIDGMDDFVDDSKHLKPLLLYHIASKTDASVKVSDDTITVFEYQGRGMIMELASANLTIINELLTQQQLEITLEYNRILEQEIVKVNNTNAIKSVRIDFTPNVHLSIDIISDRISEHVTEELKGVLFDVNTKSDFIGILTNEKSKHYKILDYAIYDAFAFAKSESKNKAEANISFFTTLSDIIFSFKRELQGVLSKIHIPSAYLHGEQKEEYGSFILSSYKQAIKTAVVNLQLSQAIWDDVTKSLKNAVISKL